MGGGVGGLALEYVGGGGGSGLLWQFGLGG